MAVHPRTVWLTGTQIGIILAVLPFAGFLTQPLWGLLSDLLQLHRVILALACFALAITAYCYTLSSSFGWLLGYSALAVLRSPVGALCDALALDYLASEGRRHEYGSLRMSFGFAVAALATGALVIGRSLHLILYLYAATMSMMGAACLSLPHQRRAVRPTLRAGRAVLLANPVLLKRLFGTLLIGMNSGIVNSYQIVYLADINAPGWVSGMIFALGGLLEVPLMAWAATLIRRWGLRAVLIGGVAVLPPRWMLYMVITDPLLVLPTQALHSLARSRCWSRRCCLSTSSWAKAGARPASRSTRRRCTASVLTIGLLGGGRALRARGHYGGVAGLRGGGHAGRGRADLGDLVARCEAS